MSPKKSKAKHKSKLKWSPKWKASPISTPQEYINSVAISADGQTVVGGTYYFPYGAGAKHSAADTPPIPVGTFAWDTNGKSLWKDQFQATEGVYWVGLSRDGKWAASSGRSAQAQGFVYIYDVTSGSRAFTYTTKTRVNMVAFSNDGTYLVAGADDTYFFSRNGTAWQAPQNIPSLPGDSVIAVAISGDGQWIVAGTYQGSVLLVKNNSGSLGAPVSWQLGNGSIHWVALSNDGSTFAVAGSDSNVHCFRTSDFGATKQPTWSAPLTGCKGCRSVAVCDDGSLVSAVGNKGHTGKVFLFANRAGGGKQLWVKPTKRNPNSTSMDSTGNHVTVADGYPDGTKGDFSLFTADGISRGTFKTKNMSWPMQISSDGSSIAAGSDDSCVYYFVVK
jgi:WD40 repeat protein